MKVCLENFFDLHMATRRIRQEKLTQRPNRSLAYVMIKKTQEKKKELHHPHGKGIIRVQLSVAKLQAASDRIVYWWPTKNTMYINCPRK